MTVQNDLTINNPLNDYLRNKSVKYKIEYLNNDSWSFGSPKDIKIIELLKQNKEFIEYGYKINLGIKTGFNDAFYLDETTKNQLIFEDSKTANLIVPLVRGRNIKKYKISFNNTWLLNTHNGYGNTPRIDVPKDYPVIYEYLKQFEKQLTRRGDKGNHWTNLRNCTYVDDFAKPKIMWLTLTDNANFVYDEDGFFINNSAYFFTGENLKYLVSILNSSTINWYFNKIATRSGVGTNRWEKTYVEQLPIPEIPKPEMQPFEILTDYITYIKKQKETISPYSPNYHMAVNFEELADACVYELYFGEHMKEKQIDVLQFVTPLLKPIDHLNEETQKTEINKLINEVYDAYKATSSPIRQRMLQFTTKSPDIINIIQNG